MKERKKISFALLLSFLFHVGILIFLTVHKSSLFFQPKSKEEKMEIEWVELKEKPKDINENVQIVQQDDKSVNEVAPKKDYKLSAKDQDVLQETKAEKNGAFQNKKNRQEGAEEAKPVEKVQAQKPQPQEPSTAAEARQKVFANLQPKMFDTQFSESKLAPPSEPAISGADISQNDDYLKDVVVGSETLLKTREFVYYSYYNRIKGKLRQHWEPRIKDKIVKILRQGRKIASTNDKITRLVITLDQSGELVRIQVKSASGYNDLDDAAIEAFRAAAPFPNPPDGIVNGTGQVEINWDFILET